MTIIVVVAAAAAAAERNLQDDVERGQTEEADVRRRQDGLHERRPAPSEVLLHLQEEQVLRPHPVEDDRSSIRLRRWQNRQREDDVDTEMRVQGAQEMRHLAVGITRLFI